MLLTAVALGLLAALLLGPLPRYLLRAGWTSAEPRAALVLWQATGLAGGLAVLGALAAVALAPLGHGLLGALARFGRLAAAGHPAGGLGPVHGLLLLGTLAVGVRLVGVLALAIWRTGRARRRHRHLVDLVGRPLPSAGSAPGTGGLVLDHPTAAAYCLPATLPGTAPRVVLTSGALALLDPDELAAVLAHERAHLAERHDLVMLPFVAWSAALRWLPTVRRSRAAVAALVEMVADDRACADCDRTVLACALARFGATGAPAGALAVTGTEGTVLARVHRLLDPPARHPRLRYALYAAATALLAFPTLALLLSAA